MPAPAWPSSAPCRPSTCTGFESTVLLAMHGGLSVVAERPFYPADICAALEAVPRPRALVTTPVHLRALLCESGALPPIDRLVCATAPLSAQLAAEGEARFGAPLYEIYGCTEAGQAAVRRPVRSAEWRTYQGVRLRQDEQGTWVHGGHVETEILLNDVIEMLGPDRFVLHGRNADLVNIAGKRTSLAYLNYQLNSIPGVRDGVFVMPDEERLGGPAAHRLRRGARPRTRRADGRAAPAHRRCLPSAAAQLRRCAPPQLHR